MDQKNAYDKGNNTNIFQSIIRISFIICFINIALSIIHIILICKYFHMNKNNKKVKQCVLIAESLQADYKNSNVFNKIVSTSAIDFTLTWLAENQIEEVFLFYSTSKKQVQEYYEKTEKYQQVKIHLNYMKPQEMKNLADVVTEVHLRNLISQDFLIMFADTITNIDLSKMVATHFSKKTSLKNVILTSAIQKGDNDKLHIYSPKNQQILQMDLDNNSNLSLNKMRISLKEMNFEFRRDLQHCDIYICSVETLKMFKQKYQYTNMFEFINDILTSEVHDERIVGYIISDNEKAQRINHAHHYYSTYLHYISRHFYPYTIYNKVKIGKPSKKDDTKDFIVKQYNKILMKNSSIGRGTSLSHNTYIGYDSSVGESCKISKCIVGNKCKIGDEVTLKNCILLDNCEIPEKSFYENCLIEKVNESLNIKSYDAQLAAKEPEVTSQPLFIETPNNQMEQQNLDEELNNLLADDPDEEIVKELYSVRKRFNKSLKQFTLEMIKKSNPQGSKGVKQYIQKWGKILLLLHDKQEELYDSLFYVCQAIAPYQKAFGHFIYHLLTSQIIEGTYQFKKWFEKEIEKDSQNICLNSAKVIMKNLDDDSDEESQSESASKSDSD